MKFRALLILGVVGLQLMATQTLFSKGTPVGKEQGTVSFVDKSDQKPVLYPVITSAGTEDLSDDAINAIAEDFAKKY